MSPEAIKALRQELGCTARELAGALGIEQDDGARLGAVDLFPTKRHVDMMEALRSKGPSAVPRKPRRKSAPASPSTPSPTPACGASCASSSSTPSCGNAVQKLAEPYTDPADDPAG